ncbi:MAG: hypothetical protein ACOH2R_28420 [Pseudomonas sp.]
MRQALFGTSIEPDTSISENSVTAIAVAEPRPKSSSPKRMSPKLRVTLHVTRTFEGDEEVFIHDANTLSTFIAEQEAKNEAKKEKFKYFKVISIKPFE